MPLAEDIRNFKLSSGCTECFVLGADATGDIPHVVAAVKGDPKFAVILFEWGTASAAGPSGTLRTLGVPAGKMFTATWQAIGAAMSPPILVAPARNPARNKVSGICKKASLKPIELHESTTEAKKTLANRDSRKALHRDLRGSSEFTDEDEILGEFWDSKAIATHRHVVVLWGRSSGKDKSTPTAFGPHPYGDSGMQGLTQLATKCLALGYTVVIAGDVPDAKRDRFAAEVVFIGKFWNDPHWRGTRPNQKQQLRLFYVLKRALSLGERLVHVGMRSGNLDYYAFAGQDVIYMVPAEIEDPRITPLTTGTGGRWTKSVPEQSPKRHFASNWSPEWLNILRTTPLGDLVPVGTDLGLTLAKYKAFYPNATDTDLKAKILYARIKAVVKEHGAVGAEVLQQYYEERSRKGYSTVYLDLLATTIGGRLAKGAPVTVVGTI